MFRWSTDSQFRQDLIRRSVSNCWYLTNVSKLAILKNHKVVLLGQSSELVNQILIKVIDNIDVGLQNRENKKWVRGYQISLAMEPFTTCTPPSLFFRILCICLFVFFIKLLPSFCGIGTYLEQANVRSNFVGELDQCGLGGQISGYGQVRLLALHQLQEGLGRGVRMQLGALEV